MGGGEGSFTLVISGGGKCAGLVIGGGGVSNDGGGEVNRVVVLPRVAFCQEFVIL